NPPKWLCSSKVPTAKWSVPALTCWPMPYTASAQAKINGAPQASQIHLGPSPATRRIVTNSVRYTITRSRCASVRPGAMLCAGQGRSCSAKHAGSASSGKARRSGKCPAQTRAVAAASEYATPTGSHAFESLQPHTRATTRSIDDSKIAENPKVSARLPAVLEGKPPSPASPARPGCFGRAPASWQARAPAPRRRSARGIAHLAIRQLRRVAERAQRFGDPLQRRPEAELIDLPRMAPEMEDAAFARRMRGHIERQPLGIGFAAETAAPVPHAAPVPMPRRVPPERRCAVPEKLDGHRHSNGIEAQSGLKVDGGAANAVARKRGAPRDGGVEPAARITERR